MSKCHFEHTYPCMQSSGTNFSEIYVVTDGAFPEEDVKLYSQLRAVAYQVLTLYSSLSGLYPLQRHRGRSK